MAPPSKTNSNNMASGLDATITIVNNSGKIISTGKQLFSIFKEAQTSYQDRKAQIKTERGIQRSQTFDQSRSIEYDHGRSRRSFDEESVASSHRSKSTRSKPKSRGLLTSGNLKALTEGSTVSSSSQAPKGHLVPYDESRADPGHGGQRSLMLRRETEPTQKKAKPVDDDLAYGDVPPDLAHRKDLGPDYDEEMKITDMVHRVEDLLDEAHCLHHTANHTMEHLQKDPDSAAAVAVSLAELSKVLAKMSPAFLAVLQSTSPAVFSLLASPQFLIGTGIAAGITVIMFGGWKIVQKLTESPVVRDAVNGVMERATLPPQSNVDEAVVLEKDMGSIETWRRGLTMFGETGKADVELMTPTADKAHREAAGDDYFDTRSHRSTKTSKTSKSSRSSKEKSRKHDTESVAGSERSHRSSSSSSSSSSKRRDKVDVKPVEGNELVLRPKPQSQSKNMLKSLFKLKEKKAGVVMA